LYPLIQEGKRLFGTDGIRGEANSELPPEFAVGLGRAAGRLLKTGPALVGRDTRRSGEMLSLALQSGFHSAGIDTVDVGIMTAGGVSFLTAASGANMGAIVSASHNAASENGIKFLSGAGTKLTDRDEDLIEHTLRQSGSTRVATGYLIGTRFPDPDAIDKYIDFLAGCATYSHRGLGLVLDCANGAAFKAAPALFKKLKATVEEWGTEPDGNNINLGCGSTHPDFIAGKVKGRIGLTFDGDADRLIAVDEDGKIANGDVILAILAKHWQASGKLKRNVVVTTVMANLGFRRAMADRGSGDQGRRSLRPRGHERTPGRAGGRTVGAHHLPGQGDHW
jgi:phosphoglucosamine mutase